MCDRKDSVPKFVDEFICNENENFKSCFARSVSMNSQYKQTKTDYSTAISEENKDSFDNSPSKIKQVSPVRYRKNNRSISMDDSRRFSCGSIVSRRASLASLPKRSEIPVENIYNQNKIDTLQWQLKEIEKSRGMYKAVMKQIVTFLEKAHVSLEHLGSRLNRKHPVPRSKSEHHIVLDSDNSSQNQKLLIDEHLSSWNANKKDDHHPDEIPPEKLSQEAFRLLRTARSLLSTQEPSLTSPEDLSVFEEPSDIEFLAQLAKEFPSDNQRTTSFSLSPKLILPENDVRISTAFNRKLSLQLGEFRRHSESLRGNTSRLSVAGSECYSLPPTADCFDINVEVDPLRNTGTEFLDNRGKAVDKTPSSPATASISSTEGESGFSSMNSFQDVGLPLVNSTAIDDVSARSVLLKSMLHNNGDYSSLGIGSELNSSVLENTLTASPRPERIYDKKMDRKPAEREEERKRTLSDMKLWQRPAEVQVNVEISSTQNSSNKSGNTLITPKASGSMSSQGNHQRWHSTPEKKNNSQSLKVLWV